MIKFKRPAFTNPDSPLFPWLILCNVIITTFMSIMSSGITIISDTTIQGELALSSPEASWVTTFYLLGLNTLVPAASSLSKKFGYRKIYALGTLVFTVGSGLAGLATNFPVLGLSRLIEGMGSGLIFPTGLAMITRATPKERLSSALNLYIAIGFGCGLGLGIALSGYFSQFLSWRDLFLAFIPLGTLATLDCWLFHEDTVPVNKEPFDLWGYLCLVTSIAALIVALSFGPLRSTDEGWKSPFILFCFALSALTFIATLWIESRHSHPLIPLELFKNTIFTLCTFTMLLLGMAFFSSVSSSISLMLNALGFERYITGSIAAIYGISIGIASVVASKLTKFVHPTALTFLGLTTLIISYFLNNAITLQSYPFQVFFILLIRGAGIGLSLGPTTAFAMSTVPKNLAGSASMLLTFFRQVGGTFGGTLLGILVIKRQIFHAARFSETVSEQIPGYRETFSKISNQFFANVSDKNFFAERQAKLEIVKTIETQAYIQAINDAMIVYAWITIALAVLLLFIIFKKRKQIFSSDKG